MSPDPGGGMTWPHREESRASGPAPVVAIVLNWNNLDDTLECVESLRGSDYQNLAVWVVDNGSDEDPTEAVRARYPGVRVVRNSENLGYGAGNNAGLRVALAEGAAYVFLVNNDAVVVADTVRRLVMTMEEHPRFGMVTPRVFFYHRPDRVYWEGGVVDWRTGHAFHGSAGLRSEDGLIVSEWLDGCALMVRAATVREIGLLDERYFLYFEDTDWSIRSSDNGWTNAVVMSSRTWHKVSRSTGGLRNPAVRFYFLRNRYLLMRTHGAERGPRGWRLRYLASAWWEYVMVRRDRASREAVVEAVLSVVRHEWGPYDVRAGRRMAVRILDVVLLTVAERAGVRPWSRRKNTEVKG